jgi:DNA mismatch repair protein MutS
MNIEQPSLLINDYMNLTKQHQTKYGENSIVLMQVGAFFEIYGFKNMETNEITGSPIVDICQLCQLNMSEKKVCVGKEQVLMAGFRDYSLEKYIPKITDGGYTVIVYIQEKNGKTVTRTLHAIYSPGTYISYETENSPQITNNIMCIWFDVVKSIRSTRDTVIYGVSIANIFTGKSFLFEHECPFYMNPTTFDELERCVSVYSPSEVIILSPFENATLNTIIQYVGIKSQVIHKLNTRDLTHEKIQNCGKQKYINHILSQFFGEESFSVCSEFTTCSMATQSLCYLLDFIQEHNPNLVRKISIPSFNNSSDRMILANHTLKQLNILDDNNKSYGHLSSVLSFLNKCCSPMGKRLFQYQLTNPTFDETWLNGEYNIISILLEKYHFIELFRKMLTSVRDLEKIGRQLVLHKLYPVSLYHLYTSVSILQQINHCLVENTEICDYLVNDDDKKESSNQYIDSLCNSVIQFLDNNLNIETCKTISSIQSFDENIIKSGVSSKLDHLILKQKHELSVFQGIQDYLNNLLRAQEKDKNGETEYVKKHETEKSGMSLQITKKRGLLLKSVIQSMSGSQEIDIHGMKFYLSDIKIISASTNSDEISSPLLNTITKDLYKLTEEINETIAIVYDEVLMNLEKDYFHVIEKLGKFAARTDVIQSKTYMAYTYNYCKPMIDAATEKSFVQAIGLRHCLIEQLQQNEIYVTNDISIGKDATDGMLLYGTNAVGKTSFIRAIGISIIMAQSGMYVPCSQFSYKPYTAIYSRILGNDNLFKGLSTFAVEMSELRIILKMSDKNSLILGDEVCSGTETESALSIFVAALMELHKKGSTFLFATHFHEIINYDEITTMVKLALCHMSVTYDRERDCLLYDRKLKTGPGNRMYGLEVCKSLYLEEEFLTQAYSIRNKYFPANRGELSNNTSVYNAKKIRGICEICKKEMSDEVHHLSPQKNASPNGFIDSFDKNHVANLMAVCEKCHDELHRQSEKKIVRKKTSKGYAVISEKSV